MLLLLRLLSRVAAGERPLKYFRTAQLLFREHGVEVAARKDTEDVKLGKEMAFKSAWRDCHSEVLTSFILLGDGIASLHANQNKILKTGPGLSIMTFSNPQSIRRVPCLYI